MKDDYTQGMLDAARICGGRFDEARDAILNACNERNLFLAALTRIASYKYGDNSNVEDVLNDFDEIIRIAKQAILRTKGKV